MKENIVTHLYHTFYETGKSSLASNQASAHWKAFSKNFQVEVNVDGSIETIKGYGFGGSDDERLAAKINSGIGNALILSQLNFPGLSGEVKNAKAIVASMGLFFSQDALRQACTCYFLAKNAEEKKVPVKNILIIGDGYGILAALLHKKFPGARIFLIDLGATLFFQAYYLGKTFPATPHTLFGYSANTNEPSGFFYCPAEVINEFPETGIDLAINIASMQEMTMEVIHHYFRLLRSSHTRLFYCCNRLEKTLADGQVIKFMEYPWKKEDVHLVDEKCPWHQFFVGRSAATNVKLLNFIPVPMLHRYDGVHWHRLTLLSQ